MSGQGSDGRSLSTVYPTSRRVVVTRCLSGNVGDDTEFRDPFCDSGSPYFLSPVRFHTHLPSSYVLESRFPFLGTGFGVKVEEVVLSRSRRTDESVSSGLSSGPEKRSLDDRDSVRTDGGGSGVVHTATGTLWVRFLVLEPEVVRGRVEGLSEQARKSDVEEENDKLDGRSWGETETQSSTPPDPRRSPSYHPQRRRPRL